jgi:hypothetical protein
MPIRLKEDLLTLADGKRKRKARRQRSVVEDVHKVTVRTMVVRAVPAAVAVFVWHRTGGDAALTVGALPAAYGALSHWLAD